MDGRGAGNSPGGRRSAVAARCWKPSGISHIGHAEPRAQWFALQDQGGISRYVTPHLAGEAGTPVVRQMDAQLRAERRAGWQAEMPVAGFQIAIGIAGFHPWNRFTENGERSVQFSALAVATCPRHGQDHDVNSDDRRGNGGGRPRPKPGRR